MGQLQEKEENLQTNGPLTVIQKRKWSHIFHFAAVFMHHYIFRKNCSNRKEQQILCKIFQWVKNKKSIDNLLFELQDIEFSLKMVKSSESELKDFKEAEKTKKKQKNKKKITETMHMETDNDSDIDTDNDSYFLN